MGKQATAWSVTHASMGGKTTGMAPACAVIPWFDLGELHVVGRPWHTARGLQKNPVTLEDLGCRVPIKSEREVSSLVIEKSRKHPPS